MFFLYTLTVLFYMTCSVYSECFFYIVIQYFIPHHDKANKLVLAKMFLSLCMKKEMIKNLPWLQYSARQ